MMVQTMNKEFPYEVFIDIDNNEHLIGRITVHKHPTDFHMDIDIVTRKSQKIFRHVTSIYNQADEDDGIYLAVQKLSDFLSQSRH